MEPDTLNAIANVIKEASPVILALIALAQIWRRSSRSADREEMPRGS